MHPFCCAQFLAVVGWHQQLVLQLPQGTLDAKRIESRSLL
jgi:hypothetical protein